MNFESIKEHIVAFIGKYQNELYALSQNESKALELAGTIAVAEHYRYLGYSISVVNPDTSKNYFLVKTSTRGYPWNFSKIIISKGDKVFEIHTNLSVRSYHDEGIYCVDIGIIKEGSIERNEKKWICVKNENLISFGEVKKLVIYPMLLAQFFGIVHEIKPSYTKCNNFDNTEILQPILISLGNFSGNSSSIVSCYRKRKINVYIAQNFDIRLANFRAKKNETPFYDKELDPEFIKEK